MHSIAIPDKVAFLHDANSAFGSACTNRREYTSCSPLLWLLLPGINVLSGPPQKLFELC
jgi:hypothetical protein